MIVPSLRIDMAVNNPDYFTTEHVASPSSMTTTKGSSLLCRVVSPG